jgi:hypothetical protein
MLAAKGKSFDAAWASVMVWRARMQPLAQWADDFHRVINAKTQQQNG